MEGSKATSRVLTLFMSESGYQHASEPPSHCSKARNTMIWVIVEKSTNLEAAGLLLEWKLEENFPQWIYNA